ncbi:hypothetical protein WOC76_00245 [Methylocystis sp. IM3]|uniref:hypothetical protein n=1 Tax=unclassified Methylocystis TaxID=2625913 RepID=UPI0030F71481
MIDGRKVDLDPNDGMRDPRHDDSGRPADPLPWNTLSYVPLTLTPEPTWQLGCLEATQAAT